MDGECKGIPLLALRGEGQERIEKENGTMVAYAREKVTSLPPSPVPERLTPQEYLKRERQAETRSEYHRGVMVKMAGASRNHNRINSNVSFHLRSQLAERGCEIFISDQRVRVPECEKYYYPDIAVVCGEAQFEDAELDTLLNPTLIVEVLSESTQLKDRSEKFFCYQTLPSVVTYVLITQDSPQVEVFQRQESGWLCQMVRGMESQVTLESIGCTLRLADIYARVTFPEPSEQELPIPNTSEQA